MRRSLLVAISFLVAACAPQATSGPLPSAIDVPATAEVTTAAVPTPEASAPPRSAPSDRPAGERPRTGSAAETDPPPTELEARDVWVFPGPTHYENDVLSFQVPLGGFETYEIVTASLEVDGFALTAEPVLSGDPLLGGYLVFADAYDTTGLVGRHVVSIEADIRPGTTIDIEQPFTVAADRLRPRQEIGAVWRTEETACCRLSYLTESAAARDLEEIALEVDRIAEELEESLGLTMPRVSLVLIDTMWGNGGYAGSEVVVSYYDRDYGPGRAHSLGSTIRHELAHAITDPLEARTPWPLTEGMAVYVTGGHYKPDPLGARAAALRERGGWVPLVELIDGFADLQHESRYVQVGALVAYLDATYGRDALLDVYGFAGTTSGSEWLGAAAQQVLGVSLAELEEGLSGWLDTQDPGDQLADLELTVRLQEARRRYQVRYAPYPHLFRYPSATETGQPALTMREGGSPVLAAVEALIASAQDAIARGRMDEAERLVAAVDEIVASGSISGGIGFEYLAVATLLAEGGLELLELDIAGDRAVAVATAGAPHVESIALARRDGGWMVDG